MSENKKPRNMDTEISESFRKLQDCATQLASGSWQLIRLRGIANETEMIDRDDIDLLGSRESIISLLDTAYDWVQAGLCHLRIKSTTPDKIGLHLLSIDGKHRLSLDLWIQLWQIDRRNIRLTYQDLAGSIETGTSNSLQRLPIALEASIFIHHLLSKKKQCSDPKQLARLQDYAERCHDADETLSALLQQAHQEQKISSAIESHTLQIVSSLVTQSPSARCHRLQNAIHRLWHTRSKRLQLLTIMGCDGSGKTTLARELANNDSKVEGVFTGKHLYRKWWPYKLLVIFLRPLLFQEREKFDDTIAPLNYLMASIRLWFMARKNRQHTRIIDRSLVDFLMLHRKTDQPKLSRFLWLTKVLGTRMPHIHIMVPFSRLRERKLEMTEQGHAVYDREMFHHFSQRCPTDYLLFDNRAPLDETRASLTRLVSWLRDSA